MRTLFGYPLKVTVNVEGTEVDITDALLPIGGISFNTEKVNHLIGDAEKDCADEIAQLMIYNKFK